MIFNDMDRYREYLGDHCANVCIGVGTFTHNYEYIWKTQPYGYLAEEIVGLDMITADREDLFSLVYKYLSVRPELRMNQFSDEYSLRIDAWDEPLVYVEVHQPDNLAQTWIDVLKQNKDEYI